jgi:hypothetical protein
MKLKIACHQSGSTREAEPILRDSLENLHRERRSYVVDQVVAVTVIVEDRQLDGVDARIQMELLDLK